MNLVDGRKLATEIAEEIKSLVKNKASKPKLVVFTCNPNFETKKFLALKQSKAESLGIEMKTTILSSDVSTEEFVSVIKNESREFAGVIVQLPLPAHIDTDLVLKAIPQGKDVDRFDYKGEETDILPPVVGAIDEISKYHHLDWQNKKVVIFGQGRLVGGPAELYAKRKESQVLVVNEYSQNVPEITKDADIIILGVGQPNLLTKDMVKDGVVIFDAGASEDGGLLVGDASKDTASKASLLTPVPGGIGPLTVILLFRNLLKLCSSQ